MSPRLPVPGSKAQAPGPQYEVRGLTEHGKLQPPAYSIKSRPKDIGNFSNSVISVKLLTTELFFQAKA